MGTGVGPQIEYQYFHEVTITTSSLEPLEIIDDKEATRTKTYINDNENATTKVWNCLEIKDAELYIDEWADYHFALGFTFVCMFDNSNNFTMRDWTRKDGIYKDRVKVTHHPNVPGKVGTQSKAYKECMEEAVAQDIDWVATIDVDEFWC
jgi:hypothetical protein